MRKTLALSFGLFLAGLICLAQAQVPMTGAGKGAPGGGAPPAYVGPGDVVSGAKAWWGLRCYTATYVGNVAHIQSPSDALQTTITCSTGGVLGTTGTALATTCAVSCTVDILYDQSGTNFCIVGTVPCDLTQTTEANRPTYVSSCIGAKPCMTAAGAANLFLTPVPSITQPIWVSGVTQRIGTAQAAWFEDAGNVLCFYEPSANTASVYAGSAVDGSATDSAFHAIQCVLNGASSQIYIDGSSSTGNAGANNLASAFHLFYDIYGAPLTGKLTEAGIWNIAPNGTQNANMNSNQHSYWGF